MEYPHPSLAADMAVFAPAPNGRLQMLVITRKHEPFVGRLALPGGFVNPGETVEHAVRRELAEETGVTAEPSLFRQLGVWSAPGRDPRGWVVAVLHVALLDTVVGAVAADDAATAEWLDADDLAIRVRAGEPLFAFDHAQLYLQAYHEIRAHLALVKVRVARSRDIPAMQEIEIAAGSLFAEIGMHDVAEDGAHETELLAGYVSEGRAWVAEQDGRVCAYALVDVLDGEAHLEQVTVHPDQGRRRIGSRLIDAVCGWAAGQGHTALTLLTFREVAWNGPYYRRLGFVELPDAELGPELAALRAHETDLGLDTSIRGAMRLSL